MKIRQISGFLFHWVLPLCVLTCAGVAVTLLGTKPKANRKKAPPRIAIPVEVVKAERHEGALTIAASGVAVPFREVALATEVSGRVVWKSGSLLPGRFVTEGEELLKINPVDYELEVARLQQQLQKADADLARASVNRENTSRLIELAKETLTLQSRELDRMKDLKQTRAASVSDYEEVERAHVAAKQQLTLQENLLREVEAETKSLALIKQLASTSLERARLDLERTVVRAPFSGVVIAHMVEDDSHVEAGDEIAKIEDTSKVEVRCNLRKEDLEFLPAMSGVSGAESPAAAYRLPPLPATVRYAQAGRSYAWKGVLSRQDGLGMDERTRTMPVRILVDQPLQCQIGSDDRRVKPIPLMRGMFVQVELHCTIDRPLLKIPEQTIRPGKTVWILEDDSLKISPIHIARIEHGMAYVDARDGRFTHLHAIISSPVPGARNGLAVTTQVQSKGRAGDKKKGKQNASATAVKDQSGTSKGKSVRLASDERAP